MQYRGVKRLSNPPLSFDLGFVASDNILQAVLHVDMAYLTFSRDSNMDQRQ